MFTAGLTAPLGSRGECPAPADHSAFLEPGQPAVFSVGGSESLSVAIVARGWKEAEILMGAGAPGVAYAILSPGGTEIRSGTIERAGWIAVSFPTSGDGVFRLELRANSQSARQPALLIRAELIPFAIASEGKLARAEAMYSSAEDQRNSLLGVDVRTAISKYQQAATLWKSAGDHKGYILALAGESAAWLGLSEYANAIAALDRAIAILGAGSESFHSLLLSMKAEVYLAMWRNQSAAMSGAQALRIARSLHDQELEARALAAVGGAEYFTHARSAASDLEQAFRLATASGSAVTMAVVLRYQSFIEEDQGHLAHALALMQEAEDDFAKAGDPRKALQTMPYLADIENLSGDSYTALMENSRLLSPVLASGDVENYANVLGDMGGDYDGLNRNRDAIAYYGKAVRAYEQIHHESLVSMYLGFLCQVEQRQNLLKDALRDCERSARLWEPIHDPKRQAMSMYWLGNVHRALGQVDLAVESYRRAAGISAQVLDRRFESQALIDWGDAVEAAGRRQEALPLFEKAFVLGGQAEDPTLQLESRFRVARWHANAGENDVAIRELKITLGKIESTRSAVKNGDLRASYLAAVRKCHQLYVDILMREHQAHPDTASDVAALEISESARARSLLDALRRGASESRAQTGDLTAERIKLRTAVDQAYDQRLKLMLEGGHSRELDENSAALTQAIDSLQRMDDAERDSASTTAPTSPSLTTEEIVEASKFSPATLFEYALGAGQSYLWVVRNGAIRSHVIHARQDEIEVLVRKWRSLAAVRPLQGDNAELARVSAELSCKLVAPFLEPGMEKLAIVADGDLALLAFASLPIHGCETDPGLPLVTAHQVVMTPSLSIFLTRRNPPTRGTFPKEVAVVADPVFDAGDERVHIEPPDPALPHGSSPVENKPPGPALPRLTGTAEEAAGIGEAVGAGKVSLFLGFNASVATVLSPAMGDYRILHLATHGVLDTAAPSLSGIVLSLVSSDGSRVGGFLKIDDIAGLRLSSELVVLSSCDSGAGDNLGGEGVTGLSHAFLEAGARRVVSSVWSVDDNTTKQLMVDFYREMFANGADPGEALRRSQLKMMARPRRSAPYYWAGFEVTSAGN